MSRCPASEQDVYPLRNLLGSLTTQARLLRNEVGELGILLLNGLSLGSLQSEPRKILGKFVAAQVSTSYFPIWLCGLKVFGHVVFQ